jgi:glutamine synthetase adenylyltransferase
MTRRPATAPLAGVSSPAWIPNSRGLIDRLPDNEAARRVITRLEREHPDRFATVRRKPAVLANVMTLAAYSPWLGDVLVAQPEIVDFLARQRTFERVVDEGRARRGARPVRLEVDAIPTTRRSSPPSRTASSARIYLRDCLGSRPLTETHRRALEPRRRDLERALGVARQELANRLRRRR